MTAASDLPPQPDDPLSEAAALQRAFQAKAADAIDRVHKHLPQVKYGSRAAAAAFPLSLGEAKTVIAREHDCQSFGELLLRIKLRAADYGDALSRFRQLVRAGDAETLDALLSAEPGLRDTIDDPHFDFGSTALIIAKENIALVDVLLKHGARINAKSQWWAGDFHILEGAAAATAQQLIERGAAITVHAAAEQGWLDWLERAYQRDPTIINQRGGDGKTPLHYATDPGVMDWLLERGAELEARDLDHQGTPLQWQIAEGKIDAAGELVGRGAQVDIFAAVVLGDTALLAEALAAHPGAIRARVNEAGYPLTPQADGAHEYLYGFGGAGWSPHQIALRMGREDALALLMQNSPPDVKLLAYCAAGDAEGARQMAAAHPGLVSGLSRADQRQLLNAAYSGEAEIVRLMASLGFDLHVLDNDHLTPLHWAAFHGDLEVTRALLDADEDPPLEWVNNFGGTVFSACMFGKGHSWMPGGDHLACLQLLAEAGAVVKPEWLPSGDDEVDQALRSILAQRKPPESR